jgi:hypothetical protein
MRKLLPTVTVLAALVLWVPAAGADVAEGFTLPDGRGWEMVSPGDKNGGSIQGAGGIFGGGVFQAAAGGSAITYSSSSSFGDGQGSPGGSQYLSLRGSAGWSTENITLPTESGAYGIDPDGVPYQLFSTDLGTAIMLEGHRCEEAEPCPRSYTLRDQAGGALTPLPYDEPDLWFAGAGPGPDLTHLAFTTCAALTAEASEVSAPGGCDPEAPNLYLRSGGALRLINLLPGQSTGTPGATLAAWSGAISDDGTRVYWTDGSDLYLRDGNETVQVDADAGGGGEFQTASLGGDIAFFTDAGHLWRYDAGADAATDLTPGGGVQGVLGASADGTVVYYLGAGGLFMWRSGTSTPVAAAANAGNYPPSTGSARVSANGLHLAFLSSAKLTAYDNAGFTEVYLYDAPVGAGSGSLICASCPSGKAPTGSASLPGAGRNGTDPRATDVYKPRSLTADSKRLFFDTYDALTIEDTNQSVDVYEWEAQGAGTCTAAGGCVALISSGRSEGGASFVDASADGADAYFLTGGSLVPSDPGAIDLYDARIGGGFPPPDPGSVCIGDACQPLPAEPEDPTPGTLRPSSPNPSLPVSKPVKKCKKGQVRRHGKCVKKKRRHHRRSGGRR